MAQQVLCLYLKPAYGNMNIHIEIDFLIINGEKTISVCLYGDCNENRMLSSI